MEYIEKKIINLRRQMYQLINEKNNLLDPEVLRISQRLDILLIKYHKNKNSSNIKPS